MHEIDESPESTRAPSGRRYAALMASLGLLALLFPVLQFGGVGRFLWHVSFWLVLVAGVHAVRRHRNICFTAIGLAAVALATDLTAVLQQAEHGGRLGWLIAVLAGVNLAYLIVVTVTVLKDVLWGGTNDRERVLGAVCVYILIGLTFAHASLLVESVSATPALTGSSRSGSVVADHLYFSFVTLSTVGYGDLEPQHPFVRLFAAVEAIGGQLYLAILIARLVGLHVFREGTPENA